MLSDIPTIDLHRDSSIPRMIKKQQREQKERPAWMSPFYFNTQFALVLARI